MIIPDTDQVGRGGGRLASSVYANQKESMIHSILHVVVQYQYIWIFQSKTSVTIWRLLFLPSLKDGAYGWNLGFDVI